MAEDDKKEMQQPEARPKASEMLNPVHDLYFGTAERTEQTSSYVQETFYKPYNPDDLFQKRGDHEIYTEMAIDDQVSVCLQLKKDLMIGSGWDILSDDENMQEQCEDIYFSLEQDPDECFDDYLDTIVDYGNQYGFACSEKRFQKKDNGMLTLKSLKTRHPDSWLIHTDDFGNISHYESRGSRTTKNIEPKAILKYTPNISTVSPYGESDLRKVYNAWFTKRHISRYLAIFAESLAGPKPVAKYDRTAPAATVTEVFNIIKNFQTKSAMAIPKEFEIEFLESKTSGDFYIKSINLFNMFIGRGLFIPDLLGFQGDTSASGGSQALGREQVDMFLKHITRRRRTLERLINHHIIQPICIYNYGIMKSYPKFTFKPPTEEDTKDYARIFLEAVKGKLYEPSDDEINHFRSLIKFPEGEVERPEPPRGLNAPFGPQPPSPGGDNDEMGKHNPEEMEKKNFAAYKPAEGQYQTKVNFASIESELNASESNLYAQLRPIIEEQFEDLFDQMRRKKIVGDNPKPERISTIRLKKLKTMNSAIRKALLESYKRQQTLAGAELFKNDFAKIMSNDEYLALLDEDIFNWVGDYEYKVTKGARIAMTDAIRNGLPISSVIDIVNSTIKGEALVSVERYSRTKHTDVMNQARLDYFQGTKLVDAYQFSAIMDGRVSEICSSLHGKIITADKVGNFAPPLHFNCRSVLIPITIFEEYTPDKYAGGKVETKDPKTGKWVTENRKKVPIDKFLEDNHGLWLKERGKTSSKLAEIRKSRGE